jgi:hypothetical protein
MDPAANGYDWRAASRDERIAICQFWDHNLQTQLGSSPGWRFFYSGLEEFYNTTEPTILQQRVGEVAAVLGLLAQQ